MHGRDLYGRYRALIERLANCGIGRRLGHVITYNCVSLFEHESSPNRARPSEVVFDLFSRHAKIDEAGVLLA